MALNGTEWHWMATHSKECLITGALSFCYAQSPSQTLGLLRLTPFLGRREHLQAKCNHDRCTLLFISKQPTSKYLLSGPFTNKKTSAEQRSLHFVWVGLPGFEPRMTGPESVVLPLHHSPMFRFASANVRLFFIIAKIFSKIFISMVIFSHIHSCYAPFCGVNRVCDIVI